MKNGDYILVKAPKDFPGKKYRGLYCYEHHLVYWNEFGVVPKDNEVIHHLDGNKHNNDINNLKLVTRAKHSASHSFKQDKVYSRFRCPGCGRIFTRLKRIAHSVHGKANVCCCSRPCIGKYTALSKEDKEKAIQNNFIEDFIVTDSLLLDNI